MVSTTSINILIVEDQSVIARDVQFKLDAMGFNVAGIVPSGEEALELVKERDKIDLALMDIKLSGKLDGIVTGKLLFELHDIPIVFLSAYADRETVERCKISSGFGYVVKPFTIGALRANIELSLTNHRIQSEFQRNRDLLKTILGGLSDCVIATEVDGTVTFINPSGEELTGWTQEEATGQPIDRILNIGDDKESAIQRKVATEFDTPDEYQSVVHARLIPRYGTAKDITYTETALANDKGKTYGRLLVIQDMTLVRELENQTIQRQKLDAIGTLAAGVAHDFNNLLMGIGGNIELALYSSDKQEVSNRLEVAKRVVEKATELTNQLLAFTRGGSPIRDIVDINGFVDETANLILSGTNCTYTLTTNFEAIHAHVDKGQFRQVIANLLVNASDSMQGGGGILISVSQRRVEDGILQNLVPGVYAEIKIEDKGVGIEREHLERLFEPYFSTKDGGHGLGLATAYTIVSRHDGNISVESTLGQGTVFTILIPATDLLPTESTKKHEERVDGSGTILVMDDDSDIRELLCVSLQRLGYKVYSAASGEDALALYNEKRVGESPIDLVVLDLTVPAGMGGEECLARLRQIDPSLKAIVSSGYAHTPVLSDYESYGFQGMIKKPYSLSDLSKTVKSVLHEIHEK